MPWVAPRTWVAGDVLTAAQLNQDIRDNLTAALPVGVDAWTSWTPTLTQGGAVNKTVTSARYMRIGRLVVASAIMTVTGAGTAGQIILAGLPFLPIAANANLVIGSGFILDSSANSMFKAVLVQEGATASVNFRPASSIANDILGAGVMTAAIINPDIVSYTATYEAAS